MLEAMSADRFSTNVWLKAFRHEAGHATAALLRGRPVNEILIHNPRWGYTSHGSEEMDYVEDAHEFIVYAGPWAEACAENEIEDPNDARAPEAERVYALLRQNPSDWVEYHEAIWSQPATEEECTAVEQLIDNKTPLEGECAPNPSWDRSLQGLRQATKDLANRLQYGADLDSGADFIEVGERWPVLYRVKDRPTHWRRRGWTPDEDEWEQIESALREA